MSANFNSVFSAYTLAKGLVSDASLKTALGDSYGILTKYETDLESYSPIINTIAGTGSGGYSGDSPLANKAQLNNPIAVAVDLTGNVYIAVFGSHRIRKINTSGTITTIAGTGTDGYSGDGGDATLAKLSGPRGVAVDLSGNVYIADTGNHRIRKMDTSGIITTIAGTGTDGYFGDEGAATLAKLSNPRGVAVDSLGNVYTVQPSNHCIRKINTSGTITTIAGTGTEGFSGDEGAATLAKLNTPYEVAVDLSGNVYIADYGNQRIRKIDTLGVITTIAGGGITLGNEGAATSAQLDGPIGIAVDLSGNIYISELNNSRIRKVDTSGIITTIAGDGIALGDGGAATLAKLNSPRGVAADSLGCVYIADFGNQRVRKIYTSGTITTIAGTGTAGYSGDLPAVPVRSRNAQLNRPNGVAVDSLGNIYIADSSNHRVRKIHTSGIITTIAGTGTSGYSGDGGDATLAKLSSPLGVDIDLSGNVYIADSGNHRIRKIDTSGMIITIAGTGTNGYSGDGGAATSAKLSSPQGIAVDSLGNVYSRQSSRIRKVDTSGIITTFAGKQTSGFSGDGGAATSAQFMTPVAVTVDLFGNVYIADQGNQRIRKVDTSGIITTIAGTGTFGYSGDEGAATSANFKHPQEVAVDSLGNVYIADLGNSCIRKIDTSGTITTIAGTGTTLGDGGAATSAELRSPKGVAVDSLGKVYIAEFGSHRVRILSALSHPFIATSIIEEILITLYTLCYSQIISIMNTFFYYWWPSIPESTKTSEYPNLSDVSADIAAFNALPETTTASTAINDFITIIKMYNKYQPYYSAISSTGTNLITNLYNLARTYLTDAEINSPLTNNVSISIDDYKKVRRTILKAIVNKYYLLNPTGDDTTLVPTFDVSSSAVAAGIPADDIIIDSTTDSELNRLETKYLTGDSALWPALLNLFESATSNMIDAYSQAKTNTAVEPSGTANISDSDIQTDRNLIDSGNTVQTITGDDSSVVKVLHTVYAKYKSANDEILSTFIQIARNARTSYTTLKTTLSSCRLSVTPSDVAIADADYNDDDEKINQSTTDTAINAFTSKYNAAKTAYFNQVLSDQRIVIAKYAKLYAKYKQFRGDPEVPKYGITMREIPSSLPLDTVNPISGILSNTEDNITNVQTLGMFCTNYSTASTGYYDMLVSHVRTELSKYVVEFDSLWNALDITVRFSYTSPIPARQITIPTSVNDASLYDLMNNYAGYTRDSLTASGTSVADVSDTALTGFSNTLSTANTQYDAVIRIIDFSEIYVNLLAILNIDTISEEITDQIETNLKIMEKNSDDTLKNQEQQLDLAISTVNSYSFAQTFTTMITLAQTQLNTLLTEYAALHLAYTTFQSDLSGVRGLPALPSLDLTIETPTWTGTSPMTGFVYTFPPAGTTEATMLESGFSIYGSLSSWETFSGYMYTLTHFQSLVSTVQGNLRQFRDSLAVTITTPALQIIPFNLVFDDDDDDDDDDNDYDYSDINEKSATVRESLNVLGQRMSIWYMRRLIVDTYNPGIQFLSSAALDNTTTAFITKIKGYIYSDSTEIVTATTTAIAYASGDSVGTLVPKCVSTLKVMTQQLATSYKTAWKTWVEGGRITTTIAESRVDLIDNDIAEGSETARIWYLLEWPKLMGDIKTATRSIINLAVQLIDWKISGTDESVTVGSAMTKGLAIDL